MGISRTNADSQWNPVYEAFYQIRCCGNEMIFLGSRHCTAVLFKQAQKKCTDLDLSLLYILITLAGTYSKFARKLIFM